jgi:DNA-directed RNA polymerase specialized sigma24 family protein
MRVVNNAIATHHREIHRHPQPEAIGGPTGQNEVKHSPDSPNGSVDSSVASSVAESSCAAEFEAIETVKARVDEESWRCIVLGHAEGWDVRDVAKATGKGTGAVYQAIHRIKNLIIEEYQCVLERRGSPPEGQHS